MCFLLMSTIALAFNVELTGSGAEQHWDVSEVPYYINLEGINKLDPKFVLEAITQSADIWMTSDFTFVYEGETKERQAKIGDDNPSVIYFEDNWNESPGVLALTYRWSSNSSGKIIHFDLAINNTHHEWSTDGEEDKHDLQNAITHEFGHALGLGHSETPEATMAPTAPLGETQKRDLHEDDIEGVVYLYSDGDQEAYQQVKSRGLFSGDGISLENTNILKNTEGCNHTNQKSSMSLLVFLSVILIRVRSFV